MMTPSHIQHLQSTEQIMYTLCSAQKQINNVGVCCRLCSQLQSFVSGQIYDFTLLARQQNPAVN